MGPGSLIPGVSGKARVRDIQATPKLRVIPLSLGGFVDFVPLLSLGIEYCRGGIHCAENTLLTEMNECISFFHLPD